MQLGPVVRSLLLDLGRITRRRPPKRSQSPRLELLDPRQLLAAVPSVVMLGAATVDSRSLSLSYDVTTPGGDPMIAFGVYRSASAHFGAGAVPVGLPLAAPAQDSSGFASGSPGVHQVTIPLAGGLPINPRHPYVLVVADPGSPSSADPRSEASFRKESIAVISHGGLEYDHWKKAGPPWEREMAQSLRAQGYDQVIAYNWVAQSSTPGQAVKQGPILARMVLGAASRLPATDPVDLQFIGHSEGAVVNTQAIVRVEAAATPQITAGFLEDTLLDPHAANPDFPGRQYSVGQNPLGLIAKLAIDNYQARARDPLAFIPAQVDAAQVFYQQSPANRDHNENLGAYNLWGQVPVRGPGQAAYFNLTSDGVVHSGKNGVYAWYEHHIVPGLGDGAPGLTSKVLTGSRVVPSGPLGGTLHASTASYAGTSAPGSTVDLLVSPPELGRLKVVGRAVAGSDGRWAATTRPLASGRYRVVAEAQLPKANPGDRPPVPTVPLGPLGVGSGSARGARRARTDEA